MGDRRDIENRNVTKTRFQYTGKEIFGAGFQGEKKHKTNSQAGGNDQIIKPKVKEKSTCLEAKGHTVLSPTSSAVIASDVTNRVEQPRPRTIEVP